MQPNINTYIADFGQKIGGAKKDLASSYTDRIALITNETLAVQPLSKLFPRPDFVKLHSDGVLDANLAVKLRYLYESIPSKPRTHGIRRWVNDTMNTIQIIKQGLSDTGFPIGYGLFTDEKFINFEKTMKAADFPAQEFNVHPFRIIHPEPWYTTQEFIVAKGRYIKFQNKDLASCIDWIRKNTTTGTTKKSSKQAFDIRYYNGTKERCITPAGKPAIVILKALTPEEARDWRNNRHYELVKKYADLRNLPFERRDWNRPRIGQDYRNGLDLTTEKFHELIPFRGVEFGNWVPQIERAAHLNEAYDALFDLCTVLDVTTKEITLSQQLALAFGARGSGKAMAHYESFLRVINLTRKKGAGSLAHEWFHGFDNYLCILFGQNLLFASENPELIENYDIAVSLSELTKTIKGLDFYRRSENADKYRSKPYWSTMSELAARAFEVYIVEKLAEKGYYNDYLANIKTMEDYSRDDTYPYPTAGEIKVLIPFYDSLFNHVFKLGSGIDLKESA